MGAWMDKHYFLGFVLVGTAISAAGRLIAKARGL